MTPVEIALAAALVSAVLLDVLRERIPDSLTGALLLGGLALRLLLEGTGSPGSGLLSGALAAGGLALGLAPLAGRGHLAWSDVKLMAGVGAAVGFPAALAVAGFVSLMACLQALVVLLWQGALAQTLGGLLRRWAVGARLVPAQVERSAQRRVPFSVAVLLGWAWTLLWRSGRTG